MNSHSAQGPTPSARRSRRAGRISSFAILGGIILLVLGAAVLVAVNSESWETDKVKVPAESGGTHQPSLTPMEAHHGPVSTSKFLNTRPEAKYVGSEACRSCHAEHAETFRHSAMGRSMSEVDVTREPLDAAYDHPASKRRYEVRRRDGKMWHRELLLTPESEHPEEIVLSEYAVKYVVGSGHHSLTYLVETDGFMVESPITWYRSRNAWAMSPGYDESDQLGFQRETGEGCLICHVGQARALAGSMHRLEITEAAIGCERCHGPGSLHVELRQGKEPPPTGGDPIDYTIVNPAHLSRDLGEAVCQQCHLSGSADILARGKKPDDFRPGLRLQDFRHDYGLASENETMTVVGHVEQMHHSRCYQKSKDFSCVTCHSPHGEPVAENRIAHYKSICLKCHAEESCKVEPARRAQESAENDCVHCHMPQSKTDIPHLAFTHHRVGIHDAQAAGHEASAGEGGSLAALAPILNLEGISPEGQKRSLGMAYLEASLRKSYSKWRPRFEEQALSLLIQVKESGWQDGAVDSGLARLRFRLKLPEVVESAEAALQDPMLSAEDRCYCLFTLADQYHRQRRDLEAIALLKQLGELRRHAPQWLLMAECQRAVGNHAAMEEALQTAVRIDPRLWHIHKALAEIYEKKGDLERAAFHAKRAVK